MHHRALKYGSFYTYFLVGLFLTMVGPLIPAMRQEFQLTYGQVSRIFLFQAAGFTAAVLLGGAAADRFDRKRLVVSGFLFLGAGLCAFALAGAWGTTLILFLTLGLGFGLGETVLNALFFDLSQGSEGKGMNALHTAPALGGIFGSLFASLFLPLGWRAPLIALGALLMVGAAWLGLVRHPEPTRGATQGRGAVRDVARHPAMLALAVLLAAYVGVEAALNGWTVTYSIETLGGSSIAGSLMTSVFWLGIAAGRIVCSRLAAPGRYASILIWSGVGAGAAYLPILLFPSIPVLAWSVFAIGLALGGVFPTAVAQAVTFFPRRAGAVTGYLFAWCTLGGAGIPAAVGGIADAWDMQVGMASVWAVVLLLIACALAAARAQAPARGRSA